MLMRIDEGMGAVLLDAYGNQNDALLAGGCEWTCGPTKSTAMYFDGSCRASTNTTNILSGGQSVCL
eukprot:gene19936-7047_t